MRLRFSILLPFLTLFFLFTDPLFSQEDLVGRWNGEITVPGQTLEVSITLTFNDEWSGTYTIPVQGINDQPLEKIEVNGSDVTFMLGGGVPGRPTFTLALSDNAKKLDGKLSQSGMEFPAIFSRDGESEVSQKHLSIEEKVSEIEGMLSKAQQDWDIPGIAVAIVKDDSILFAEGFGQRDIEGDRPVTTSTLFAIGSTTKAFTSVIIGTLVDEGKLDWNTPVLEYIPDFRLYDDYATTHLTVRDLLTHVSGLPRHDLMWYGADFSREELFNRLRYLEPTAELRQKWQYQNLMYMVAGLLAEHVSGMTWEELVEERIFKALGMHNATLSVGRMERSADFSWPYNQSEDKIERIDFRNIDAVGPAGSINAGVDEMAQWLRLNLNGGEIDGKEVVSKETLSKIHAPQAIVSNSPGVKGMMFDLYGMGWMIHSYRGHRLLHHGGGIDGFVSHVGFLPDDGIGIVVLTNRPTGLPQSAMLDIIDRMLDLQPYNHLASGLERQEMIRAKSKEIESDEDAAKVTGTSPTFPIGEYSGMYEHPGYGIIKIDDVSKTLKATFNGDSTTMHHFHYDVFYAREEGESTGGIAVSFEHDVGGGISALRVALESSLDPIRFVKLPSARLNDAHYLRRFCGDYGLSDRTANVSLQGATLILKVGSQPPFELLPRKEVVGLFAEFGLEELSGYRVRFQFDGDNVSKVVFIQPNGTFIAEKQ